MKVFFKVLVVALFAAILGLAGCGRQPPSDRNKSAEAINIPKDAPISVLLPTVAEVVLKKGEPKSGRLTAIDGKQLKIEGSGRTATVAIAEIEKVTFKGDIKYYSNGKTTIRGEDKSSASDREIWSDIPLSDFTLQDPKTGAANVKLTASGVVTDKILGIQTATHLVFVVDKMSFNPTSGKMTIEVLKLHR
jgi:predicted small lipoprotein YifL